VSNRRYNELVPSNEISNVERENWTINPAITSGTFSPEKRILGDALEYVFDFPLKAFPQSWSMGVIPMHGFSKFLLGLFK
jgi:hypothetical protein